jgi:pimeloyl-ACP methyl ester carboxylesterase
MAEIETLLETKTTAAAFRESFVEADGFHVRYMEAGEGPPLPHLHGAGGPRLTRAHELLSQRHRVIAFEMPGFGRSQENTRTRTMEEMAAPMATTASRLGIATFDLMGTSFGGEVALWLAVQQPERLRALVLEAPAAIRPVGTEPPSGSPEEMVRRLYAHPERLGRLPLRASSNTQSGRVSPDRRDLAAGSDGLGCPGHVDLSGNTAASAQGRSRPRAACHRV